MSETFRIVCSNCGQGFRALAAHIGMTAKCMKCGVPLLIQRPAAEVPSASAAGSPTPSPSAPTPVSEAIPQSDVGESAEDEGVEFFSEEQPSPPQGEDFAGGEPAASAGGSSAAAPRRASGSTKWLAIGSLAAVAVGLGGVGGYLYLAGGSNPTPPSPPPQVVAKAPAPPTTAAGSAKPAVPARKLPTKKPRTNLDRSKLGIPGDGLAVSIDDLTADASTRYELVGGAVWEEGSLKLKDGAGVVKAIPGGPSIELALWVDLPRLKSTDADARLRCVFTTGSGRDVVVEIQRLLQEKRRFGRVAILDRPSSADAKPTEVNSSEDIEDLAGGWWAFCCHQGVVCVTSPRGEATYGFVPIIMAPITGIRIENVGPLTGIREIQLGTTSAGVGTIRSTDSAAYQALAKDREEWFASMEKGDVAAAKAAIDKSKEEFRRIGGEDDVGYLACLGGEAALADLAGDLPRADKLLGEYVSKTHSLLGEAHPWSARATFDQGISQWRRGEPDKAESLFDSAIDQLRRFGPKLPELAQALNVALDCAIATQKGVRIVSLRRDYVECLRVTRGETDPEFHRALEVMSLELLSTGGGDESLAVHKRALELARANPGEKKANLIDGLVAAFDFDRTSGNLDQAVEDTEEAIKLMEEAGRTDDPLATVLAFRRLALSDLLPEGRKMDEDEFRRKAEAIESKLSQKETLDQRECETLAGVAFLSSYVKKPEKMYSIAKRALDGYRKLPHYLERDEYVWMLRAISPLAVLTKKSDEMKPLVLEGIQSEWTTLDRALCVVSESERRQPFRSPYGGLVDAAWPVLGEDESAVREQYALLAARKDLGYTRSRRLRAYRADPSLASPFEELNTIARRILFLSAQSRPDSPLKMAPLLAGLVQRQSELEREVGAKSAKFRRLRERPDIDGLIGRLDESTAIIDIHDYLAINKERKAAYHAKAFVLRKGKPIQVVSLGELTPIEKHFAEWRARRFGEKDPKDTKGEDHAAALKKLVWTPLDPLLDGVQTVLISPNPSLAGFPFAALPGKGRGSYLIEEYSFAVLPSVANFAGQAGEPPIEGEPSFVAIAHPDMKAKPGFTALGDGPFAFAPDWNPMRAEEELPSVMNSEKDAKEILALFQSKFAGKAAKTMFGQDAKESEVRGEMGRHRFVHLAGRTLIDIQPSTRAIGLGMEFFTSRGFVDMYANGPRAGIAVVGANVAPEISNDPKRVPDDGYLTSTEIAGLDWSGVELLVLSASDAGLGLAARGEGLVSLARAIHDAGVRSAVLSLWRTDEPANRALYGEFYRNLWEKGLSKVGALREAQLRMMRDFDVKKGKLRSTESESHEELSEEEKKDLEARKKTKLPPYYWAGIVLSGDWR